MNATIGTTTNNQPLTIGDIERRSGLYILGKTGMQKTSLITNLINHDIKNDHGLFFIDPHGEAIDDIVIHQHPFSFKEIAILDPETQRLHIWN
jgi:hypothetical protein